MSRPRLYVVALSHLDTQWRWTVRDTVERFLPATVEANEPLFERHPSYTLSFEGSYRYRLLAEHHPRLFELVEARVAAGRWHPAGAAVEAFDTLLPSPESIGRQILYGRRWFRRQLGRDSRDLFLPDCFGFPVTLPSLAAHFGVVGFATQKLRRGALMRSAFGIPFAFGRWRGPDGGELLAALDPGEYSGRIAGDLTRDAAQLAAFEALPAGVPARRLLFVGIGDRGGAVPEETVARLGEAIAGDGPIEVRHGPSDRLFVETTADERAALPVYDGELLLRVHATGCYTAKALLKRWNRRVERLARLAETAATAALAAGRRAPRRRLEAAWELLLAHQMHDDLTGTAIPEAYRYSLADLGLAANELAEIALDGAAAAATTLGAPRGDGGATLLAVTPLACEVDELVEVEGVPAAVDAIADADGAVRPIQRLADAGGAARALLPVAAPGAGIQRLRLRCGGAPPLDDPAEASEGRLENRRYRVELGPDGALRSVVDKRLGRELLAAPAALELLPDRSAKYPAWEILWQDVAAAPLARVERAPRVEIVERGPLRAAIEVERRAAGVVVRERWSLAAGGSGERLESEVEIVWRRRARLLKARFALAAENDHALYDTGLGAIRRPIASEALYEVPAQSWAAIVDRGGEFGVALLADARCGWDQPDGRTLRSTWIHAPRASFKWRHQATQDFGVHRFRFALAGLAGDEIASGAVAALADRFLHRPWLAWERDADAAAARPARRTLLSLAPPLRLLALKPAEDDDRLVARLSNPSAAERRPELNGELAAHAPLAACDGMEQPLPEPTPAPLRPSGLATWATTPLAARPDPRSAASAPLDLAWSLPVATAQGERGEGGGIDGGGRFLPLELLPERLDDTAAPFDLASGRRRRGDAVPASGQTVELPAGTAELWLLATAAGGDREVVFEVDGEPVTLLVPDGREALLAEPPRRALWPSAADARFRRRPTAWSCGHLHDRHGDDLAMERATLYALRLPGGQRVKFPADARLRIVAATVAVRPLRPLVEAEPVAPA